MRKENFIVNSTDYDGNQIRIECEGIDDKELAHFGGLDLFVKAARKLIASTDSPMSFPEKNGDNFIKEKVVGLLLNEIGELIRSTSIDPNFLEGMTNIELINEYLHQLNNNKEVVELLRSDELKIRKFKEEQLLEELNYE